MPDLGVHSIESVFWRSRGVSFETVVLLSLGLIAEMSHVNKFGENQDVTKNTTEDVWTVGGTYSYPTTADMTHLSQAANQTAMQGEDIIVEGLNINWEEVTQTVTLNGANTSTAVVLATPLLRVNRMFVAADVVIDQIVSLKNVGGGTTYSEIPVTDDDNQTLQSHYSVPANKTGLITNYYIGHVPGLAGTKDPARVEFKLKIADRAQGWEFQTKHEQATTNDGGTQITHSFFPYLKVTEKSDIKITAGPTNDRDAHVHGGFDIILVDSE